MLPSERHPAPGASAPPDTLRQRSVLPSWPEAGKPFGDTRTAPRWPWPGNSPAPSPARRPHTGPQRGGLRRGLLFAFPPPTPAQAHQTAAALQKPWSEANKHPSHHRVGQQGTLSETPSMPAQAPALPPKGRSQSLFLPVTMLQPPNLCLSVPVFHMVSAGADSGRQKTFPTILIYLWSRATTRRSSEPLLMEQ